MGGAVNFVAIMELVGKWFFPAVMFAYLVLSIGTAVVAYLFGRMKEP